jgi:hypothetical protein
MTSQKSEVRSKRSELNAQLSSLNSEPSIEVRIEELVLQGFTPSERYSISGAVEGELARLFEKQGVPNSLRSEMATDEINGGSFNATRHTRPKAIGWQIAQAVYGGFGK